MHLSLIGMSGSGKSLWSAKLSDTGFRRFCCDELISEALGSELTRPNGSTMELGEWMGFPYEPGYGEREARYLAREIEVLNEILQYLESGDKGVEEDIVVDTTGSVIYTGEALLKRLRQCTTVVHLSTPPEIQELMFKAYVANQRPILWRGLFAKAPRETNEAALARCYQRLLSSREGLYEQHADVTIDYYRLNQRAFEASDFLKIVHGR
jgi:shikimate kinase